MKLFRTIMTMPVAVEVVDAKAQESDIEEVFAFLRSVDERFSWFKPASELSAINARTLAPGQYSSEMREVLALCEKTRQETDGYFDIHRPDGTVDTTGIVKGWGIFKATQLLDAKGYENYCVEIAGDLQVKGQNAEGGKWRVGIRNPFGGPQDIVKVVELERGGIATSGTYERGSHIYNPHDHADELAQVLSLTVIGPDVLEADRFATAAFAMGTKGIYFIETLSGFEGYQIDMQGIGTATTGFGSYEAI
jgi:FAD:protein FMN transferase